MQQQKIQAQQANREHRYNTQTYREHIYIYIFFSHFLATKYGKHFMQIKVPVDSKKHKFR